MQVPVISRSLRQVLFITLGFLPFQPSIAEAQELAVAMPAVAQTYTGECTSELSPDRAVIVGGISAQGLKPGMAKAQLDKQIEAVRQYVDGKKGRLLLLEVLRAVQPPMRGSSSVNASIQPFILVQSLEAEFPATAEVDAILEHLLQLGLDRYGRQVRVEASSSGPSVVVYYRFSNLRSQLDRAHAACKQRLVAEWCSSARGNKDDGVCKAMDQLDQKFPTLSASFQSSSVLREHGGRAPYYLSFPWQSAQLNQVELIGNTPLSLSGPLTIRMPYSKP